MQLLVWEILLQLQLEVVAAAKSAWLSAAAADVFAADAVAAAGVIAAAGDWVEGEWLLEAWVNCPRVA